VTAGDRPGSGGSAFRVFLQGLPDDIARAARRGQPITCPDPGTDHGRRLLRTLGVEIVGELRDPERAALDAEFLSRALEREQIA
jgi:hypothetical protein